MSYKLEMTRRGLIHEAIAAITLLDAEALDEVRPSTKSENIYNDIDFHGAKDDEEAMEQLYASVSVKCQQRALETGNLSFELEQQLADGSWVVEQGHHKSKATHYAIIVGPTLYYIQRSRLDAYIEVKGWERVTTLSYAVKDSQKHGKYKDARNGLVAISKVPCTLYPIRHGLLRAAELLAKQDIDIEVLRKLGLVSDTLLYFETVLSHIHKQATGTAEFIARRLADTLNLIGS